MEPWLVAYLESERDSMFQNNEFVLQNRRIHQIDWIPDNKYFINLSYNQLEVLPPLHAHIHTLHLTKNQLRYLPILPTRLEYLRIDGNPINQLPSLPPKLNVLNVNYCQLTELPTLPRSLEYMYVAYNLLTSLPELPDGLHTLDVEGNDLYELPYLPDSLRVLRISGNRKLLKYSGVPLQKIKFDIQKRIANQKCRQLKEELMMATWHPRRIERWLSLGMDIDEL